MKVQTLVKKNNSVAPGVRRLVICVIGFAFILGISFPTSTPAQDRLGVIDKIEKPPDGAGEFGRREPVTSVLVRRRGQSEAGFKDMPLSFGDEMNIRRGTPGVHRVVIIYDDPKVKQIKLAPGDFVRLVNQDTVEAEGGFLGWVVGKIQTTTKYIQAIAPGTQYALEVVGEKSRVFVWEGEVQVSNKGSNAQTVAVKGMHLTETFGAAPPSAPRVPSFDEIKDIVLFGVDLDPVIKATITDENLRRRVHEDLVRAEFESRARSTEVAPQINLGNAYLFLGKYEDALRKFDEAERISARPSEIYNGRGVALAMLGRQAEAVAAFQQALARDKDAKFHNNLGNLYLLGARDSQAVQQAVAAYDQSLKLDKLNAAAYNGRGVLALVQQAVAEAGDYFSQSLQVKDRAVAHSNLGNARLLQNDLPAARSEYDRAIQLDAADGAALNNRGVAHLRERNFPAAKADFEAAIGVIPQDATPYLGLGLAHVGLKEFGPAAAAFIKSVQLHPANRTAYRNLAFLYFTEESVRASIESQLQETAGARADVQPAVERFLEFLRSLTAVSRESFDASFERFQLPAGAGR